MNERIKFAIELSQGAKNPEKAAEKFTAAKDGYERAMRQYEDAAQKLSQILSVHDSETEAPN